MDTTDKTLIMISLLHSNKEKIKKENLYKQYFEFYGEKLPKELLDDSINNLKNLNLIIEEKHIIEATEEGQIKGNKDYINFYFSDGVVKSECSDADKLYKKNKNLGLVNSDSIIDDEQIKFIIFELENITNSVFDLGCGRGEITSCIQDRISAKCIGVDRSESMINISKKKKPEMNWILANIEETIDYIEDCGAIILIDSIYFIKNKMDFLKRLYEKINNNGKIIITFSTYTENPESKEELLNDTNEIGKILKKLNFEYKFKEFTTNEITLWKHREQLVESLQEKYKKENNYFLYYDKKTEASNLLRVLNIGLGKRYIYVIKKK